MPNALIGEQSPYLLQHSDNPVDWMPWSDQAFAEARQQDKLVFLSAGYSTCHWCHVMAHESFENEKVAKVMNHHFINIKIDREERPDIDALYMQYLQVTTGQGGWPMSVWLDGEGRPVFGGTYFPPEDKHGRAGFVRICQELARLWRDERSKLLAHADKVMEHLQKIPETEAQNNHVCSCYLKSCHEIFDVELGGFGGAPKFPRPALLDTLMTLAKQECPNDPESTEAWRMTLRTLQAMALGGMHDHLAGGFHRYSVDRYWHIPHYEKMLYDQGQLATTYLEAWEISGDVWLLRVAEGILSYLSETMLDDSGAFHTAEDADSFETADAQHPIEGAFWTWRAEEIQRLLPPMDAAIFSAAYNIQANGNARPESDPHGELEGRNTLHRVKTDANLAQLYDCSMRAIEDSLATSRATLLAARLKRPLPHRDDKIITAWNGLTIAALAKAGRLLNNKKWLEHATTAAMFFKIQYLDDGDLFRSWRSGKKSSAPAIADDYVFLIHGLIELHHADIEGKWLSWAEELQQKLDDKLWDESLAGYVMRPQLQGKALMTLRNDYDGAEPSPNHLAILNLQQLAKATGMGTYKKQADALLKAACKRITDPFAAPIFVRALANKNDRSPSTRN